MIKYNKCSDEELVAIYKSGDDNAFNELYMRYALKLKKVIYWYILNPEDVEDVFHETNIRVFTHINSFKEDLQFSSWIYKIAINCSKNHLTKRKKISDTIEREKYRVSTTGNVSETPEQEMINHSDMVEFNKAVSSLKNKFKDVFILRFDHKLKYKEIAEILSCSERTAKWRMQKAIEEITDYLSKRGVV